MTAPWAYLNGRFVPVAHAALPLHDAGFVQGATVTDLVRTFRHEPYLLSEHLTRFRQSCALARLPLNVATATLEVVARELVARNAALLSPEDDLGLVLFATPGPIGWYLGASADGPPTFGMHTFPLPWARYASWVVDGVKLLIPSIRHLPATSVDRRVKHRSRLFWRLAELEVRDHDPTAQALLLDADGSVTETAAANFLLVRGDEVLSPPAEQVLPGVSLGVVRDLCSGLGLRYREQPLRLEECVAGDGAVLTCTTFCLAPVASLAGHAYPQPWCVYERLVAAWSARVGVDLRQQLRAGGA